MCHKEKEHLLKGINLKQFILRNLKKHAGNNNRRSSTTTRFIVGI